jgi:ATP-dependent RNA helicase DDX3X
MNSGELFVSFNGKQIDNKVNEKFSEIGLNDVLMSNFQKMNFDQMTPIQKNVIPIITEGNDVMACSQTGSGKTIAFLAPIVNKMLNEGPPVIDIGNFSSAPIALILIPTRELAEQIYKEGRKLLHQTGIQITKIYGGVPHDSQLRELREGTDILVATPGRLIDFLNSRLITLQAVKYLILDEADRILDLGFSEQLNSITFNYGIFNIILN